MSQITHFCYVKLLTWKSGCVKLWTNIMTVKGSISLENWTNRAEEESKNQFKSFGRVRKGVYPLLCTYLFEKEEGNYHDNGNDNDNTSNWWKWLPVTALPKSIPKYMALVLCWQEVNICCFTHKETLLHGKIRQGNRMLPWMWIFLWQFVFLTNIFLFFAVNLSNFCLKIHEWCSMWLPKLP